MENFSLKKRLKNAHLWRNMRENGLFCSYFNQNS